MTRTELIDHLKAGWPVTNTIVKEVVAELGFSRRQDAELKRLLAMQSDLDLQGYEHMRDELQELRSQFAESQQRVKELEEALQTIAEGRGMLRDRSTIYMNGRVPEVPTVFSRREMQEIAKETLEATCTK